MSFVIDSWLWLNITDTLPHIDASVTSIIQWKIIYLDPVVATLVRDTIEPVFVDLGTAWLDEDDWSPDTGSWLRRLEDMWGLCWWCGMSGRGLLFLLHKQTFQIKSSLWRSAKLSLSNTNTLNRLVTPLSQLLHSLPSSEFYWKLLNMKKHIYCVL